MSDPVSMTLMAAGAATSAYSSIRGGQAAYAAGKYNKAAAYNEAEAMDIQAGQEIAVGTHNSARIAQRAKEIMAQQRAAAAAGGGSTVDATVVAIQNETVKTSTLDQLMEMAAAEERAQQIRHGAVVKRKEGDYALAKGREARTAGYLSAAGTLLQAGSSWADKFGFPGSGGGSSAAAHTGGNNPRPGR